MSCTLSQYDQEENEAQAAAGAAGAEGGAGGHQHMDDEEGDDYLPDAPE